MIGAMQEFNYQYGVDSYIRIGFDFTSNLANSEGTMYDYRLELRDRVLPFCPSNPDTEIKFYVNGMERAAGVPHWHQQPYFIVPEGSTGVTIEFRTNGPFLERMELENRYLVTGLMTMYFSPPGGGWVGASTSMGYVSFVEISDASGLTKIGWCALRGMHNVNTVILPATVNEIVDDALQQMNPYATLICKAKTPPSTNGQALFRPYQTPSKLPYDYGTLYVPKGCAQTYRQPVIQGVANDWSRFQNILELDY